MDSLKIVSTHKTPEVILDKVGNKFEFHGHSRPEDPETFYAPIRNWITDYSKNPNDITNVVFRMEYFNTSSSRAILRIINQLEQLTKSGRKVQVSWYYSEDDQDMADVGQEFSEIVSTPFEIISSN